MIGREKWRVAGALALFVAASGLTSSVHANGLGENVPWQFRGAADAAALSVVQDQIAKRKGGVYRPPTTNYYYHNNVSNNTSIQKQINCNNSVSALGNSGTTSGVAASPGTAGASSSATGNLATTSSSQQGPSTSGQSSTTPQDNQGAVGSNVNGSTQVSIPNATTYQALNSTQTNSGAQTAGITGSTACGVLN